VNVIPTRGEQVAILGLLPFVFLRQHQSALMTSVPDYHRAVPNKHQPDTATGTDPRLGPSREVVDAAGTAGPPPALGREGRSVAAPDEGLQAAPLFGREGTEEVQHLGRIGRDCTGFCSAREAH